ncbi:hypothetical protein, variant 1 [Verruconis gallopava]|uniref:Zn(2)-C6 fungal-type domain-containing protein n=1 Tax=Verruconis gallopava TaxID=253628 RepID=A0A0D2B6T5_9PEZI|nr:hypothetical protein, variant 1 [Verruconis gallopava]KIW06934.1 hypothetical protein, variant 1 [Verruconis gallopava]
MNKKCDPCRARKVKCDKESPCSACRASNLSCVTSEREKSVKRKRIHVSDDYERKIDMIEAKLASLDQVLQRPLHTDILGRRESLAAGSTPSSSDFTRPRTLFSDADQPDADGDAYEGDTSLSAHSIQARALVERVLGQGAFASTSPEVSSAVSSLLDMSNGGRKRISRPVTRSGSSFDYRKLPLPPTNLVLDVLRRSKENRTVMFDLLVNWMSLPRLTDFCKSVFFSVDEYPPSTAIIVFGNLFWLFEEFSWRAPDEQEKNEFRQCADLCRTNFETSVSSLDIFLPATPENVEALLMAAMHGIDTSRLNVSWKLKSVALTLAQTLGWHRAQSVKDVDKDTRVRQEKMFYFLYVLDKGLSLRLGRASFFQDYDIDLPYPELGDDDLGRACTEEYRLFIQVARVQGLIYEQLYSPGALRENTETRIHRAQMLVDQLNSIRQINLKLVQSLGLPDPNAPYVYDVRGVLSVFLLSDEVTHYTNIAMCYRVIPADSESGLRPECLDAARSALESHQSALRLKESHKGMWKWYFAWTLLFAPFIPFLVVFSNVISTADNTDLVRLRDFVASIADSDFCEGARKMHHICSMFYRIAKLYVDAKARAQPVENQTSPVVRQASTGSTPYSGTADLNALNPYLNAIGFAGDPMLDMNTELSADVGDWFTGNQFVMGLMDNDMYSGHPGPQAR